MRILSYCLMPNHWHFVLWPESDGDLGRFMQRMTIVSERSKCTSDERLKVRHFERSRGSSARLHRFLGERWEWRMANQLKMAKVNAIHTLAQRGWSQRRIAESLGINRRTVARYLSEHGSKCTKALTGPDADDSSPKCTKALTGPEAGSTSEEPPAESADALATTEDRRGRSACEPFREIIIQLLEMRLTATRIHQDLRTEHGYTGSYFSVMRFVRKLKQRQELPFRRIECAPGEEAQVDFGTGAPIIDAEGKRRRTHVLRVVLSHSRKGYSQAVFRQTTENFIDCLENAFHHFDGVPKTLVIDNLKAAVSKADWYDPELNPKLDSFARHYGIAILPTKPRMPRHKGKVERGVDYVQENGLKGRKFDTLQAQNDHLLHWETNVADTRIHGTTKKHVGQLFRTVEQGALQPLPRERFPCFQEAQRRVSRDGHVEVAKSYYSAPPEYLGAMVWVRWTKQLVRIYDKHMHQIAIHPRREPGQFSTLTPHIASEKINRVERGASYLLRKVRILGPHATRWAEAMVAERGVPGVRVLQGLLALASKHDSAQIEHACEVAWSHGEYRLRTVRKLIGRTTDRQTTFEFLEEHPIIRPLSDYGEFIHNAFQRPDSTRPNTSQGGVTHA